MKTFTVTYADAEKLAELLRENAEYRPDYFGSLAAAVMGQFVARDYAVIAKNLTALCAYVEADVEMRENAEGWLDAVAIIREWLGQLSEQERRQRLAAMAQLPQWREECGQ